MASQSISSTESLFATHRIRIRELDGFDVRLIYDRRFNDPVIKRLGDPVLVDHLRIGLLTVGTIGGRRRI